MDADFAQFLCRMLCRFGFELASRCDPGYIAQVYKRALVTPHAQIHLPYRFQKGQGLDVAYGAANFHNRHVGHLWRAQTGAASDEILNFIGDVRNDLHRFSQEVAAPLFF